MRGSWGLRLSNIGIIDFNMLLSTINTVINSGSAESNPQISKKGVLNGFI